ncbi:MAG: hypothetical protein ACFFDI_30200, partial [Promethearchaeota archaeon]
RVIIDLISRGVGQALIADTFVILFGVWILNRVVIWQIYLYFLLIVDIVLVIPLFIFQYYIGYFDPDYGRHYTSQRFVNSFMDHLRSYQGLGLLMILVNIILYVVIGVLYFALKVSALEQTEYIVTATFGISSLLMLANFGLAARDSLSPKIESKVRQGNLFTAGIIIYRLTFISYFILWVFDVGIFDPAFNVFGVAFYWFYIVLFIALLLFLFVTVVYAIGESRHKREQLDYLSNRNALIGQIGQRIDLQNMPQTKEELIAVIGFLNEQIIEIDDSLTTKLNSYIAKLDEVARFLPTFSPYFALKEDVEADSNDYIFTEDDLLQLVKTKLNFDLVATFASMEQAAVDQAEFLQSVRTTIQFTVDNFNSSNLVQLNIWFDIRKLKNDYALERCESIQAFPWKINSLLGVIWTVVNAVIGLSLSSVLESVSNLFA